MFELRIVYECFADVHPRSASQQCLHSILTLKAATSEKQPPAGTQAVLPIRFQYARLSLFSSQEEIRQRCPIPTRCAAQLLMSSKARFACPAYNLFLQPIRLHTVAGRTLGDLRLHLPCGYAACVCGSTSTVKRLPLSCYATAIRSAASMPFNANFSARSAYG